MSDGSTDKFREEYIKKSNLVNRSFLIILGLSLILLLFIILPYYLALEHLDTLENKKKQLQTNFITLNTFNKSLINYFEQYEQISEPLIDNDFKSISLRIYDLVNTGRGIYPQCEDINTSGEFFKCNIMLMIESEYRYLVNNQSKPMVISNFENVFDDWEEKYQPRITALEQRLNNSFVNTINDANTISSILPIAEKLNVITKTFFEQDIPKEIVSIFLLSTANTDENTKNESSDIIFENGKLSLRDLLFGLTTKIKENENSIENTTSLVSSITTRIGSVQTPVVSVALGFEEILVFSPVILAISYLACLFILLETNMLKKNNLASDKIINGLNPLLFDSSNNRSRVIRLCLLCTPLLVYIISTRLVLSIWEKFDAFFLFTYHFEIFVIIYAVCGIAIAYVLIITIIKRYKNDIKK